MLHPITKNQGPIYMAERKGVLQKLSIVSSIVSFVLAFIAGVMLYLQLESVGSDHPISASLMASTFFFVAVGVVLLIIGNADLPSFKFDDSKEK
jgi:tetrahydromethanopterin S-methyltransferase subunit D